MSGSFHCAGHPPTGWSSLPFSRQENRPSRGSRRGLAECAGLYKLPPKARLGRCVGGQSEQGVEPRGRGPERTHGADGRANPSVPSSPWRRRPESGASAQCGDTMACTGLLTVCLIRPPSPRPPALVAGPSGHALFQDVSGEWSGGVSPPALGIVSLSQRLSRSYLSLSLLVPHPRPPPSL